ncbi:MAG: hypothetical protein JXB49_08320 [Bacteroidales bacterium]|nr:hypothetical protein [Bacteroidales bacterium]
MDNLNPNPNVSISDHRDTFVLDRSFILTQDKTLVIGMPYLYAESNHTVAVRLLKVWVEDNTVYLDVQELKSPKTFTLSWNLNYTGSYWLWSLADYDTLTSLPI